MQYEVVYYTKKKYNETIVRLVKFTALLDMLTAKRGEVIEAKAECLDVRYENINHNIFEKEEIGTIKNLSNCYSAKLTKTDDIEWKKDN